MIYKEWKAERQAAMDARTPNKLALDQAYQQANQSDAFYYGLESRVEKRQESKIPIAGAGAVTFFSIASNVTKPLVRILPFPFLAINTMFFVTEQVARERAGL